MVNVPFAGKTAGKNIIMFTLALLTSRATASRVLELQETDYDTFRIKCEEAPNVCVVRKWAESYPSMRKVFTFDGLLQACRDRKVETWRYSKSSKKFAKMVSNEVEPRLHSFIRRIQSGQEDEDMIFDESIPTLCLEILHNYTVPFMAANDYVHRMVTGRCNWFSGRDCEASLEAALGFVPFTDHPSLFIQPKGTKCGEHIDAYHSHFLQVLHVGKKQWHVRFNGKVETVLTGESDLIFVPAGTPHSVANLEAAMGTSINWIDSTNWPRASRTEADILRLTKKLWRQMEAKHQKLDMQVQGSLLWEDWVAGVKRDHVELASRVAVPEDARSDRADL